MNKKEELGGSVDMAPEKKDKHTMVSENIHNNFLENVDIVQVEHYTQL